MLPHLRFGHGRISLMLLDSCIFDLIIQCCMGPAPHLFLQWEGSLEIDTDVRWHLAVEDRILLPYSMTTSNTVFVTPQNLFCSSTTRAPGSHTWVTPLSLPTTGQSVARVKPSFHLSDSCGDERCASHSTRSSTSLKDCISNSTLLHMTEIRIVNAPVRTTHVQVTCLTDLKIFLKKWCTERTSILHQSPCSKHRPKHSREFHWTERAGRQNAECATRRHMGVLNWFHAGSCAMWACERRVNLRSDDHSLFDANHSCE